MKDFDLSERKGSVFGYLGPNGAGNTTTVREKAKAIIDDNLTISIGGGVSVVVIAVLFVLWRRR